MLCQQFSKPEVFQFSFPIWVLNQLSPQNAKQTNCLFSLYLCQSALFLNKSKKYTHAYGCVQQTLLIQNYSVGFSIQACLLLRFPYQTFFCELSFCELSKRLALTVRLLRTFVQLPIQGPIFKQPFIALVSFKVLLNLVDFPHISISLPFESCRIQAQTLMITTSCPELRFCIFGDIISSAVTGFLCQSKADLYGYKHICGRWHRILAHCFFSNYRSLGFRNNQLFLKEYDEKIL